MSDTDALIARLSDGATPVRRLRPPMVRAGAFLGLAGLLIGALVVWHGPRGDLGERMLEAGFAVRLAGCALTGVIAAVAAAMLAVPGRSRLWAWAPAPAVGLWLGSIGVGCLGYWVGIADDGLQADEVARCAGTLLLAGMPLSAAMLVLLRRAAPRAAGARPALLVGGLAAAGMTALALTVMHPIDASLLVLAWNAGTAAMLLAAEWSLARLVLVA